MLLLARISIDSPLWAVLLVFFIFGFGMGNVIAPGSTVLQNVLPLARAGAGSAVQNTVRQVAGALGVAVVGTVLATQYAANLTPVIDQVPEQFPEEARQAATESIVAADQILDAGVSAGRPGRGHRAAAGRSLRGLPERLARDLVHLAGDDRHRRAVVFFLLPQITPPEKGDRAVGAPADPTDALVRDEVEHYSEEAAEEYVVRDKGEPA